MTVNTILIATDGSDPAEIAADRALEYGTALEETPASKIQRRRLRGSAFFERVFADIRHN